MSILLKRSILFFALFPLVQLTDFKLIQANFNINDIVHENDVNLTTTEENTYKITSSDGPAQTFHIYDIVTLIGTYVEFDTCNSESKIQCIFDSLDLARSFVRGVKPSLHPQAEFSLFLIAPVMENDETNDNYTHTEAIVGAQLYVELGDRFVVLSAVDESVAMIFSAAHFNISHVLSHARVLLVVQIHQIRKEEIITLKFLLSFTDDDTANRFYKYVKEDRFITDNLISVDIPSRINP